MHSFSITFAVALFFGAVSSASPIAGQVATDVSTPFGRSVSTNVAGIEGTVPSDNIVGLATNAVGNNLEVHASPRGAYAIITGAQAQIAPLAQQICKRSAQTHCCCLLKSIL